MCEAKVFRLNARNAYQSYGSINTNLNYTMDIFRE